MVRLTRVLFWDNYRWILKMKWRTRGVVKEPKLIVPKPLQENGVEIIDANEMLRAQKLHKSVKWEPPIKDDPNFMPENTRKDHPDYHEEPVYDFNLRTRLLEGDTQALILTKSQPFYHTPPQVDALIDAVSIPNQDELVQRYIMQANLWDPTKDKLPRRINVHQPGWRFKAEWGIPRPKRNNILLQNLIRLCQMIGGRFPDFLENRRLAHDHYISTFYYFQGDKHIQIRGLHHGMMSSNRLLPPIADEEQVDQSVNHQLPDLYPLSPTIDLKHEHIYRLENITGWNEGFSHPYPHTMFLSYTDRFAPSGKRAKSLMYCFAQALAFAKQTYGWDVKHLPEPITTQCIATDGENFHFTTFQLNTLNFDSSEGVKNFVWFDTDNLMYNKILPKRAMLRNTQYQDYDPKVFKKILATFLNGVDFEEKQAEHVASSTS